MARARCALVLITALLAVCGGQLVTVTARPLVAAELPVTRFEQLFQQITISVVDINVKTTQIAVDNVLSRVPVVVSGLSSISYSIQQFNTIFASEQVTPFGYADATRVVQYLKTFVDVHQVFLNTLIGKHEVISRIPVMVEPVCSALVVLESAVDNFAVNVLKVIPSQKSDGEAQFSSLSDSLSKAVSVYRGGRASSLADH